MSITTSPLQDVLDRPAAATVDVRPILTRSDENAWEQTERIRAELYLLVERACAGQGIEALVLQSPPYAYPAWVKFESWTPRAVPAVTARATMTVTIVPTPYRRFEALYKVEWTKDGQSGVVDQLYQFGEVEVQGTFGVLTSPPSRGLTWRRVRWLLRPVQLRQQWFQLWKPTNKFTAIRRDWVPLVSIIALLAGAGLLIPGLQGSSSSSSSYAFDTPALDSFETPSISPAPPDAAAVPTAVPQSGALDDSDPRMNDGRIYELRTIQAAAGVPIVVTMRSTAFDTYLVLGQFVANEFTALQTNDDAGDDGTNSRIEFVPALGGEYVVLYSSYEPGRTGDYSFTAP
jgi:hypothetical protein